MQVLKGSKREITLMLWDEQLQKAKKRLADSTECYNRFKDKESKQWMEEDKKALDNIQQEIQEVIEFMNENNIK